MIRKSPWISIFNASSCNGCDLECIVLITPRYDIERFGCLWKSSPRHADILLVTGPSNKQSMERLKTVYDQMASTKKVIAIGTCGCTGCIFKDNYNTKKRIDEIIPIDIYVPGCPPRPEAIINALIETLKQLKNERNKTK